MTPTSADQIGAVRLSVTPAARDGVLKVAARIDPDPRAGVVVFLALWARFGDHGAAANTAAPTSVGVTASSLRVKLTEFAISPRTIDVPANRAVDLQITNGGQAPHGLAVRTLSGVVQVPSIDPGASATLRLPALPAGTYDAWCPVPGHQQAGMDRRGDGRDDRWIHPGLTERPRCVE